MRFEVMQHFAGSPAAVAAAFTDPALYAALGALSKVGEPELLEHRVRGDQVHLEIRYRFTGDLAPAARAILDPAKLTWVELSDHDLSTGAVAFTLRPDNYGDRMSCAGTCRFDAGPAGTGTTRTVAGDLKVRAPLVAGQVERAIVSGLREHLDAEVAVVDDFVAGATPR